MYSAGRASPGKGDHLRLTTAAEFAGTRDGGDVKFLFGCVSCSELRFGSFAYHPVTLCICPWAPVAPLGHKRCDSRWETAPLPVSQSVYICLLWLAGICMLRDQSLSLFCAALQLCMWHCFACNYVDPASRHSCRVFMLVDLADRIAILFA
jgi:hypothetical protein